ncbi:MAG: arginine--tRNA ligase, partial [Spirochaetaceae bacterium]|nr:arginine--tRNA ligase [Spirochaetaceae bacterium]
PESLGVKSDRFVGDLYVKFSQWAKNEESAEEEAQAMLQAWENGDDEIRNLWKTMNGWALSGINATYERTGVSFDRIYRESETYLMGKDQVLKGLESGVFYKDKDGSIRLDMSDIGLDTKVLLRSDGTSVYMTQDLGTAINRHDEWPFDQLIYVVGSEQEYHFRVLFYALKKLGFTWADKLRHLSYGMVNLPEGKMKSREGTVVDADDLIDKLSALALAEIKEKGRENAVGDAPLTAEKIAIAALHYFLLQVSPSKDMIFNPEESLAFNGNTGPYLQYMVARVSGLIAKAPIEVQDAEVNPALLNLDEEWELSRRIAEYPELVSRAAEKLDPSILAAGLYEIAKEFSRYYHDVPIARADNPELAASRMALAGAVLTTLKSGFNLLNIPYIESM